MRLSRIERCLAADMTVKEWCSLNKVAESSLYKWMARFHEEDPERFPRRSSEAWGRLASLIISRREYRMFRGLRSGAHAACVSLVSRMRIATSFQRAASHVDVAQVDSHRPADEAVDHGVGLDAAAEAAVSLRRRVLRAQHRRLRRVASLDRLEQEADVLGEPFVDDQQLEAGVLLEDLGVRPLVANTPVHLARLLGGAAREVALPRAGAALYHHVGRAGHELARACLEDQHLVDAAPLVDHLPHLGVRESQPCPPDQPLHARRASPRRRSRPSSAYARRTAPQSRLITSLAMMFNSDNPLPMKFHSSAVPS